jgi:hypothetical protein
MPLRFRRRDDPLRELLAADAGAVAGAADHLHTNGSSEPDLARLVSELFSSSATTDIEALRRAGVDGDSFYDREVSPNWDDHSQGERWAKVTSFMRLANVLGTDDAAGLGPLVRTKVVVLAWAYDRTYGEKLLNEIRRRPGRFGTLELSS